MGAVLGARRGVGGDSPGAVAVSLAREDHTTTKEQSLVGFGITSGWLKLVGERQGGVGGPVGAAAVAAYDVEMGDGAVKPNSV